MLFAYCDWQSDAAESGGQSGDELFEPLTPDHSPSNLFLSDEGEDQDDDQVNLHTCTCLILMLPVF